MASFQSLEQLKKRKQTAVLDMYEELHQCWFEQKSLIPDNQLLTIRFEDLKKNPLETMDDIYQFLDCKPDTNDLKNYLQSVSDYQQNKYDSLTDELENTISQRFRFVFDEFSYPVDSRT